jgi:hypothetical protein
MALSRPAKRDDLGGAVTFPRIARLVGVDEGDRREGRRALNDQIAALGRSFAVPALLPFRCECGRLGCEARIALRTLEYDAIRSRGEAVTGAH